MKAEETVIVKCETHWLQWSGPLAGTLIFLLCAVVYATSCETTPTIVCVVIALLFVVKALYNKYANSLILTDSKVIGRRGIIHVKKLVSPIWKIQSVEVEKGLLGRIFGYANIGIDTAGTGTVEYTFKFIKNADEFQQAFVRLQDEMRSSSSNH